MLVECEPAVNVSNAIDVVAYRNNTILRTLEIDHTYISVEDPKVGEKEMNVIAYAVMV